MLVLTRKQGEQVIIQGNIRITVVSVGPGRVKIGIDAPADVKIDREEIHARKQDEELPAPAMIAPAAATNPPMPAAPVAPPSPHGVPAAPASGALQGAMMHNRIAGKLPPLAANRSFRRKPR